MATRTSAATLPSLHPTLPRSAPSATAVRDFMTSRGSAHCAGCVAHRVWKPRRQVPCCCALHLPRLTPGPLHRPAAPYAFFPAFESSILAFGRPSASLTSALPPHLLAVTPWPPPHHPNPSSHRLARPAPKAPHASCIMHRGNISADAWRGATAGSEQGRQGHHALDSPGRSALCPRGPARCI